MRKHFFFCIVLTGCVSEGLAQGLVNGANGGSGVFITIQDTSGALNGGIPVKIGTPANAAGFIGAGPAQVNISLYAAINGTPLAILESPANLVASTLNAVSPNLAGVQGTELLSRALMLPAKPGFDGSQPLEFIYFGESMNDHYAGWSLEATDIIPAIDSATPPDLFGKGLGQISAFNLISTPDQTSTLALGVLGGSALWLFHRRKLPAAGSGK